MTKLPQSSPADPDGARGLVELHRNLVASRLVLGSSGNASWRDGAGRMLIKSSGMRCEDVAIDNLATVELATGRTLSVRQPSSDARLHLAVFGRNEAIRYVAHTHSPQAAACSALGDTLEAFVSGTAERFGSGIPCLPFNSDRTSLAEDLDRLCDRERAAGACLLGRHGVLVWSTSWEDCLSLAELVEWSAKIALICRAQGIPAMLANQISDYVDWYGKNYPSR